MTYQDWRNEVAACLIPVIEAVRRETRTSGDQIYSAMIQLAAVALSCVSAMRRKAQTDVSKADL